MRTERGVYCVYIVSAVFVCFGFPLLGKTKSNFIAGVTIFLFMLHRPDCTVNTIDTTELSSLFYVLSLLHSFVINYSDCKDRLFYFHTFFLFIRFPCLLSLNTLNIYHLQLSHLSVLTVRCINL